MYEYINQLMNKQINLFKHFNSAQFDSIQSESIQFNLNFYFYFNHNRSIAIFISAANISFDCYRVDLNRDYFFIFFIGSFIGSFFILLVQTFIYWLSAPHTAFLNVSIAFDDNLLAYKIKWLVGSTFSSENN